MAKRRDGRRGVPATIIRVNYRAVSPFGKLLTLSLGQARSLDRSRSLNPVANLYRDWTSYRRASTSAGMETARRMEFARRLSTPVQRCRQRQRQGQRQRWLFSAPFRFQIHRWQSPNRLGGGAARLALFPAGASAYFANVLRIYSKTWAGAPIKFVSSSNARSRSVYIAQFDAIRIKVTSPAEFFLVFLSPVIFISEMCTFDLISLTLVLSLL